TAGRPAGAGVDRPVGPVGRGGSSWAPATATRFARRTDRGVGGAAWGGDRAAGADPPGTPLDRGRHDARPPTRRDSQARLPSPDRWGLRHARGSPGLGGPARRPAIGRRAVMIIASLATICLFPDSSVPTISCSI